MNAQLLTYYDARIDHDNRCALLVCETVEQRLAKIKDIPSKGLSSEEEAKCHVTIKSFRQRNWDRLLLVRMHTFIKRQDRRQ